MKGHSYTPGPWKLTQDQGNGYCVVSFAPNRQPGPGLITRHIATICPLGSQLENCANGTLIAAAPELLEALEELARFVCDLQPGKPMEQCAKATALIARIHADLVSEPGQVKEGIGN